MYQKTLEITEEGEVRIEGEEVQDLPMQIPPEVLEELNKQIVLYTPNQGGTEIKQSENKEPIITEPDEVEGLSLI